MKNFLLVPTLASVMVFVSPETPGQNLGFLEHSPTRYFTDQDWEISNEAYRRALERTADGKTVT